MNTTFIKTSDGVFTANFSERGLSSLEFPVERKTKSALPISNGNAPAELRKQLLATRRALQQVLGGKQFKTLPPLDLSTGTAFQRRVWETLLTIPAGEVRTYGQIARAIGKPKATRAVGAACGANPIPVLIPCHRVVAANGGLGGFSAGLEWKLKLLAREKKAV